VERAAAVAAFATDPDRAFAGPHNCAEARVLEDRTGQVGLRELEAAKVAALAEFAAGAGHEIES